MASKRVPNKRTSPKINGKVHEPAAQNSEASPLEILLGKAKKQKTLTQKEVLAVLPDGGLDVDATVDSREETRRVQSLRTGRRGSCQGRKAQPADVLEELATIHCVVPVRLSCMESSSRKVRHIT